jgi:hypothetical protein
VIAVERSDEPPERTDRLQVALLDRTVGDPQRLIEPRDLQMRVTLGRVEPPLGDRAVDLAPAALRARFDGRDRECATLRALWRPLRLPPIG